MTFTLLSFNFLRFISTPSNRLLTCAWFYLRYNKKIIQSFSVVLFPVVLKAANFLLPYLCSVFPLLCRKPDVRIFSTNYARSLCLHLDGVFLISFAIVPKVFISSLVVHKYICCDFGECCESVP